MGIFDICLGIFYLIITFVSAFKKDCEFVDIFTSIASLGFSLILIVIGFSDFVPKRPMAIDVYRHKTTLQITYKDSIPQDTVVVWKDK